MKNRLRRKYQQKLNREIRLLNKNIAEDDLWNGRFIFFQKDASFSTFEDKSGGLLYAIIRCYDKKTAYYCDYRLEYAPWLHGIKYKLFMDIANDFIVEKANVWDYDPRKDKTNYNLIRVDINKINKLDYNFYVSYKYFNKEKKKPKFKKKTREEMNSIYYRCFNKAIEDKRIKQIIFYGVKYIRTFNYNTDDIDKIYSALNDVYFIEDLIARCSFLTIMNIFPIAKEYDGKKYSCKDYFSTKEYLDGKDLTKLILEYDTDEFLDNYFNNDILNFNVNKFMICDRYLKKTGKKTIMERFAEDFGLVTYKKLNHSTYIGSNGEIVRKD